MQNVTQELRNAILHRVCYPVITNMARPFLVCGDVGLDAVSNMHLIHNATD